MNQQTDVKDQQEEKKNKKQTILLLIFFSFYILLALFFILRTYTTSRYTRGEFDSYILPTISILNHGNMIITEDDMQQAAIDYPECYDFMKLRFDSQHMAVTADNGRNPYYFCTYSIACIPFKLLLKLLHLPQILSFFLTNLTLLLLTFLFVYRNLNVSRASKVLSVLLLAVNPIFFYITWCSAEVFIFCMLTLSLVCYLDYKYKRAALLLALAGTLNVTSMFFGFIMIGDFFYRLWKTGDKPFVNKKNLLTTLTFGACFLPVFLPFIHNMIYVNEVNNTFHMFQAAGVLGRFSAYLFDLNFGIFPYMPVQFILLLFVLYYAIRNKNGRCLWLTFAMFGIVLMYSFALHINCDMAGVSRYGSWTTPFLILIITAFFPYDKIKQVTYITTFSISIAVTGCLILTLSQHYGKFAFLPRLVLDHAPALYNPLYSTFNNRLNGIDGGYDYLSNTPIIYYDFRGGIRKILLPKNQGDALLEKLSGDEQSLSYLANQLAKIPEDGDAHYVNIPTRYNVYLDKYRMFIEGECILDSDTEFVLAQQDDFCIASEDVELENDTFYKVEVVYWGNYGYFSQLNCDFFGGATYDSVAQESQFVTCQKLGHGDYLVDCILYSGDVSQAIEQPRVRILNYSFDIFKVKEIRVIQLEEQP